MYTMYTIVHLYRGKDLVLVFHGLICASKKKSFKIFSIKKCHKTLHMDRKILV